MLVSDTISPVALPQPSRALAWLRSPAIVDGEGRVYAWHNPRHPGFDYPEAAGLWLQANRGRDALVDRVALEVAAKVRSGAVGRDGTGYVFDLGVVLAGLLAHDSAHEPLVAARRVAQAELLAMLGERRVTTNPRPARWSTRYGPHLLKLVVVLARLNDARAQAVAARLFDDLAHRNECGRFLTDPCGGATYVHAHAYAVEGLACLARTGDRIRADAAAALVRRAADWLADVQGRDGGLPSHHDGARPHGPPRADATAQAARIWACVDPHRQRGALDRALAFLARSTTADGGVRYEPDSDDLNAWATIFTIQAGLFAREPKRARAEALW